MYYIYDIYILYDISLYECFFIFGCELVEVSFNAVASACEKSWQWRRALLLGPRPDAIAYNVPGSTVSALEE